MANKPILTDYLALLYNDLTSQFNYKLSKRTSRGKTVPSKVSRFESRPTRIGGDEWGGQVREIP